MGNRTLSGSKSTMPDPDRGGKFIVKKIRKRVTYYYTPVSDPGTSCPSIDPHTSLDSADPSSTPLLPDPTPTSSRPLLVFFAWLGAKPRSVAKYRNLYMDRGLDVLVVYSSVMHFLWPRWGLDYGLEVLNVLEEAEFAGRPLLVHATSIGGFTFTQVLTHIARGAERHSGLGERVKGHVYDSLVAGSLEHMATGLGKTLAPRFEGLVKNLALFYFRVFKSYTADMYEGSVQVFLKNPVTAPALFYYSEDDALCDPDTMDGVIGAWRGRGVSVDSRRWKESTHAAHMRCHPQEYVSLLDTFLGSLDLQLQSSIV